MSSSSQTKADPTGPVEQDFTLADQSAVKSSADVVTWPKNKRKVMTADVQAGVLAKRQAIVLRVLAEFSNEVTLQGGLMAAANALKMSFRAVRVSIGLYHNDVFTLTAVSQQANIDSLTEESELICKVMYEALDKDQVVVTDPQTLNTQGMQAHRLLCAGRPERQVLTVPMFYLGECIASVCIERDSPMPMAGSTVDLIRQIGLLLAPSIAARRQAERGIAKHASERLMHLLALLPAPRYVRLKAIGLLLAASVVIGSVWQTTDWVKASAELVPLQRRIVSAPIEGYVHSVEIGSGEQVSVDDVLLRMDTSDAELESAKWQSELDGLNTEMRAAMASGDRRKMAMLSAEIDKTSAQLSLAETRLARSVIRAPVNGVVVSGELSQIVGAAVSRGQLLLELAPEKGYEVHLMVEGDQINKVQVGDSAKLRVQAFSAGPLDIVVERIHPIGIAQNGANRFRVIASTSGHVEQLKPGQTGIAKINVGKASILHVLTNDFLTWLSLKKWEWLG